MRPLAEHRDLAIDVRVLRDIVTLAETVHYVTVQERDSLATAARLLERYDERVAADRYGRLIDARA